MIYMDVAHLSIPGYRRRTKYRCDVRCAAIVCLQRGF
jgi:hypothetical protein